MIFNRKHNTELYNTLLTLSRDIFFYKKINLPDNFETRIYLMLTHFSIMLIVSKKKNLKFDQKSYDFLFQTIENNLRELGFGDVSVNQKMKDFNKILYDILLKIEKQGGSNFIINDKLIKKYFSTLNEPKNNNLQEFISYFVSFYNFCFDISHKNMIIEALKFKYYGSS